MRPNPAARRHRWVSGLAAVLLVAGACAPAGRPAGPPGPVPAGGAVPAPGAAGMPPSAGAPASPAPTWPAPPLVTGALAIRVVYPKPNDVIAARDSNFVFGSVGSGDAALTINGTPVPVQPDGAFLAWLPVPAGTPARYEIVAARGADTARAVHAVRPPAPITPWADTGRLTVQPGSVFPSPGHDGVYRRDEPLRVTVRTSASAEVLLRFGDSTQLTLISGMQRMAMLGANGRGDPTLWQAEVPAGRLGRPSQLVVMRGPDTVRVPVGAVAVADTALPPLVQLVPQGVAPDDSDRVVIARPVPGGTYHWFLLPGTIVAPTGRQGDALRVRLDRGQEAWVANADGVSLPPGTFAPRLVAGNARVVDAAGWVDVVIPIGERPPFRVEAEDRRLVLTLYGTTANVDLLGHRAGTASLVRRVTAVNDATDRARFVVELASPVFGWQVRWQPGGLVLRVRRPPPVNPARPLEGLLIAADPGHPPIGSTGPTGLYEPTPVRWVAEQLAPMLEARGARVLTTRTVDTAVALEVRPQLARRADAHAFVSIHLNALPDGTNPFNPRFGSGTYWFHSPSAALAREVQRGLVERMGLPDEGTYFDNLAVVRQSWMPSVLTEGAYIMFPTHEAWLKLPEFQRAYALGIAEGLERYFRALGESVATPSREAP
ncbi:MAG: N-acetylmuramoyl-L-alanine amidase [Gemmatimonadota bacterium]